MNKAAQPTFTTDKTTSLAQQLAGKPQKEAQAFLDGYVAALEVHGIDTPAPSFESEGLRNNTPALEGYLRSDAVLWYRGRLIFNSGYIFALQEHKIDIPEKLQDAIDDREEILSQPLAHVSNESFYLNRLIYTEILDYVKRTKYADLPINYPTSTNLIQAACEELGEMSKRMSTGIESAIGAGSKITPDLIEIAEKLTFYSNFFNDTLHKLAPELTKDSTLRPKGDPVFASSYISLARAAFNACR